MKKVAIVLGYQLNKDSSMDELLIRRLNLMLKLLKEEHIDNIIVSGGRPQEDVLVSEAERMYDYLVEHGVDKNIIYKEEKSGSTVGNAKFSMPIARELGADVIVVVSTIEHFTRYEYNPIKIFKEAINDEKINLMIYTDTVACK